MWAYSWVYVHVCISMFVHKHEEIRSTKDNLEYPSSSAVHLFVLLYSESQSGLELAKWARMDGQ